MGDRKVAAVSVAALLVTALAYLWAGEPSGGVAGSVAVPSFAPTASVAPPAPTRPTLLPTNCADLLAGSPDMAALLGLPLDAVNTRAVIGLPSPSVGQLERVTCTYTATGQSAPGVVITAAAFTTPEEAVAQRDRNAAAESDTRSAEPVSIGAAHGSLLTEPGQHVLFVAYDRYLLTAGMNPALAPGGQVKPVLVDLVQRVLANLAPVRRH
jgi:hypothetical protein